VANERDLACVETNELLPGVTDRTLELLNQFGIRAAVEPPTQSRDGEMPVSRQ